MDTFAVNQLKIKSINKSELFVIIEDLLNRVIEEHDNVFRPYGDSTEYRVTIYRGFTQEEQTYYDNPTYGGGIVFGIIKDWEDIEVDDADTPEDLALYIADYIRTHYTTDIYHLEIFVCRSDY